MYGHVDIHDSFKKAVKVMVDLHATAFSLMKLPFRHCRYKASQYGGPDGSDYSL